VIHASVASGPLRTIVVDLTPVLPGGENGGAKFFALELIARLASMRPQSQYVLLTQAASHAELAALDSSNVRRMQVIGSAASSERARLFALAGQATALMPEWAKRRAARAGYWLHSKLKRGSGGVVRRLQADLLFCPFTAPTFHQPGIPTVCTVYDLQFRAYPQFFAVEDVVQRERAFAEASRKARVLAAISDFTRASAESDRAAGQAPVRTIYMRIAHPPEPAGAAPELLARLGLAPNHYFLYPANYWRHKNHEMLLAAFASAAADLPPGFRLVCTGSPGARERWLRAAAARMGLGEKVLFAGYLPRGELQALLRECRGMVFPSLFEGFGLPVLEAMSAGVPVACSDLSALPEAAGSCALLFDPRVPLQVAQALRALALDEPLRTRLVEAGLRRAAEFGDPARMALEYWELFELAASPSGSAR